MLRKYISALFLFFFFIKGAIAAPNTLVQTVTHNGETITMRLTKQNLRGEHFELWTQDSTGTYHVETPVAERSYLGTVDEYPDAVASGILQDDETFRGAVYFDRGGSWFTLGNGVQFTRGDHQPATYGFPEYTVDPGQAGTTMYGFTVGIDAAAKYFHERGGSDVAKTFEYIEFSVAATRAMYMTNMLARPYLGRVIIRTSHVSDPATGHGGGAYLEAVRQDWVNNHTDAHRNVVAGISSGAVGGGLAWVGVMSSNSAVSVNDSGGDGEFSIIWRHELGHNWGLGHHDGGMPEGATINSNNQYARMSGPELKKALDHRNGRLHTFSNEGTYTGVDLPPYAAIDRVVYDRDQTGPMIIDALANDHDANGDSLSLLNFDETTTQGGSVKRYGDLLVYLPAGGFLGVDTFTYVIEDSSGQTATGVVAIDVQTNDSLRLYLPLDETSGTTAHDFSAFRRSGNLANTDFANSSTTGRFGNAVNLNDSNQYVSVGNVRAHSNTITLTAWIKPNGSQNNFAGILFDRSSTQSGLNYGNNGELRYHWNNNYWGWDSGLKPTNGVWNFVALVVEPDKATLYLNDGTGFQSATNHASHGSANFSNLNVGRDPNNSSRYFKGAIDEVRLYTKALNFTAIETLYAGEGASSPIPFDGATNVGEVDLSWTPSPVATQYRVYLGTDETAVANADTSSDEYQGTVTVPVLSTPATAHSTTHYWRVDTITSSGVVTGPVWKFTRSSTQKISILNHSFEDGAAVNGVPPAWSLLQGTQLGVNPGGSHGSQFLWIGPGTTIQQVLPAYSLSEGETITLNYDSARDYGRQIQLLAKNGNTYQLMAETNQAAGSGSWPTITLNHTVSNEHDGKELVIRIISAGWNEFDNFQLTVRASDTENADPFFTSTLLQYPDGSELLPYQDLNQSLAEEAEDPEGDPLIFGKISGPSWLEIAEDGSLSGTPGSTDSGENIWLVWTMDSVGNFNISELHITVLAADFYYDLNGSSGGSGVTGTSNWDSTAQWSLDLEGTANTFSWIDGATAIFSAGDDAVGTYTVQNQTARIIGGFTARTGFPQITGSSLQLTTPSTPFIVETNALGAKIEAAIIGSGGMVKSGPGTLTLDGNNTFTGNILIEEGILELTNEGKLYNSGHNNFSVITIGNEGVLRIPEYTYSGMGKLSDFAGRRVIDGGTIEVTGDSVSSSLDFTVTEAGGTFRNAAVGKTLTLTGNANTKTHISGELTFDTIGDISLTGTYAYIQGSGSIVKTGTGTLVLGNGRNSFSGDLTANEGLLRGSAIAISSNSSLGVIQGDRNITITAPASMLWDVNNILGNHQITSERPTIILNNTSLTTTRFNVLGKVTLHGSSLINSVTNDPVSNYEGLQFLDTVTATGTDESTLITTTGRGNHLIGGETTEFFVPELDGKLTIDTVLLNGSKDFSGTGSLKKTGNGKLVLTKDNIYQGTTTVDAGILELTGSLAGTAIINDSGKLSGNGSIAGAVTVQSGGTIAPTSAATLRTGELILSAGSSFIADGSLEVTGDADISAAEITTAIAGSRVLLSYSGTRNGEFGSVTLPAGWQLEYADEDKEIRLVEVSAYEQWIAEFETNGLSGFYEDADGDGLANGLEFLLGSDPTLSGGTALPTLTLAADGSSTYLFNRMAHAREICNIAVIVSNDLKNWTEAAIMALPQQMGT